MHSACLLMVPCKDTIKKVVNGKVVETLKRSELMPVSYTHLQDPYASINPQKKIGWLLEEPLVIHHREMGKEERQHMVKRMLQVVGLDESYKDRYPGQLSGGQRQRVSIALALILNPSFVVADEPVSALDVSVQAQILNLMKRLQKEYGLTYLFISHDLNVVSYMRCV